MTSPTIASGRVAYVALVVQDYLEGMMPNVRVCTEAPADRPPLLVTITTASTADGPNLVLSWRRLTIYCSATGAPNPVYPADWPAEVQAGVLAEDVFMHLENAETTGRRRLTAEPRGPRVEGPGFRAVTVVGTPARQDDPDENKPRFQLTVDVLLRAGK